MPESVAKKSRVRLVARLMWIAPVLFFAIGAYLVRAPFDLARTLRDGTPASADVVGYETTGRADVSYDAVTLRAALPGGRTLTQTLPLLHGLSPIIEGQKTVAVRVLPGAVHEMVIESARLGEAGQIVPLGRTQVVGASVNAAISFVFALMLAVGIGAWNRFLARHGDPGERTRAADALVPAR